MARTSPNIGNPADSSAENDADVSSLPFEDAISRLEAAVLALENGGIGLDEALSRYEQGVRLLQRCHALLERAERQVALLTGVAPDGTPQTAPFESEGTAANAPGRRRGSAPDADAE